MNPKTPSLPIKIAFLPSIEDQIYIAECLWGRVTYSRSSVHIYRAFLFLNVICFPAFLIFSGYLLIGLLVFAISFAFSMFLVPANEKKTVRRLYEKWFDDYLEHRVEVQLMADGITSSHNGNQYFLAWKNVTAIQETPDSIFFFQPTSGIAVRKDGFDSAEQQAIFIDHARHYISAAKTGQIEKQPVSVISA